MGCSTSKLDNEEAVQLCKDRKNFIKQAVEHRLQFASGHLAYIQSLRRVSDALRDYIEGDEPREFLLDSFKSQPFTPIKKTNAGFISITPKPLEKPNQFETTKSSLKINYLRSGGNQSVAVEERPPQSPETVRVEAYSPNYNYRIDSFFSTQLPANSSSYFSYPPNNSPPTSQWDSMWNLFSSLDYYGYPNRSSLDQSFLDDDVSGLRQVREEEGIPELEEETEQDEPEKKVNIPEQKADGHVNFDREEVVVEDTDDETDSGSECHCETDSGLQSHGHQSLEVSKAQNAGQVSTKETAVGDLEDNNETPGFTVYVNRRPTSMAEVSKELEAQFTIVCDAAAEVSAQLEASRAQYSPSLNEHSAVKMLNPVALIRSASSRSSSSRFMINTSSSRDESYDSNSDFSDESCMLSGGHQSTLEKLYAWEKKLYKEVREGERVRIAYEKKCSQLRNQDVKGEDPSSVDKTRTAIRDLHTQIKVSLHSIESVSRRIETLRDEELQPQVLELVQGLTRMWKVMAESHQVQKRALDEAKLLLAGTPSKISGTKKHTILSPSEPHQLARSAANLEAELRNWRACFKSWITAQRSYVHALAGWLLRCARTNPEDSKLPFSPRRSAVAPPIFGICIQWSRFLDGIREASVLDGLDFFTAGVGSLYAQQLKEESSRARGASNRWLPAESGGGLEVVEVGRLEDELMTAEKMAEVAIRVLCAGMSVAMSSLTEFAIGSAEGYADLVKQWENAKGPREPGSTGT
ncbi:hypothetical protein NMG60_11023774 [Bertholletia excelsa]